MTLDQLREEFERDNADLIAQLRAEAGEAGQESSLIGGEPLADPIDLDDAEKARLIRLCLADAITGGRVDADAILLDVADILDAGEDSDLSGDLERVQGGGYAYTLALAKLEAQRKSLTRYQTLLNKALADVSTELATVGNETRHLREAHNATQCFEASLADALSVCQRVSDRLDAESLEAILEAVERHKGTPLIAGLLLGAIVDSFTTGRATSALDMTQALRLEQARADLVNALKIDE